MRLSFLAVIFEAKVNLIQGLFLEAFVACSRFLLFLSQLLRGWLKVLAGFSFLPSGSLNKIINELQFKLFWSHWVKSIICPLFFLCKEIILCINFIDQVYFNIAKSMMSIDVEVLIIDSIILILISSRHLADVLGASSYGYWTLT